MELFRVFRDVSNTYLGRHGKRRRGAKGRCPARRVPT